MASLRERWSLQPAGIGATAVIVWGRRPEVTDAVAAQPARLGRDAVAVINRVLRIRWRDDIGTQSIFTDALGRPWQVSSLSEVGRRRWLDVALSHVSVSGLVTGAPDLFVPQTNWGMFYGESHPDTGQLIRSDIRLVRNVALFIVTAAASPAGVPSVNVQFNPDPDARGGAGSVWPIGTMGPFVWDDPQRPGLLVRDASGNHWELASADHFRVTQVRQRFNNGRAPLSDVGASTIRQLPGETTAQFPANTDQAPAPVEILSQPDATAARA